MKRCAMLIAMIVAQPLHALPPLFMPALATAQAHEMLGSHGGVVTDAGSFHVEVVTNGEAIEVYLTDHANKAVPSANFKGTAVLVVDGKAQRIQLSPADANRLIGKAQTPLPAKPKGAIQLQTATGSSVQGKLP